MKADNERLRRSNNPSSEDIEIHGVLFPQKPQESSEVTLNRDIYGSHVWLWLQKYKEDENECNPVINKALNFNFRKRSFLVAITVPICQLGILFFLLIELITQNKVVKSNLMLDACRCLASIGILLAIGQEIRSGIKILLVSYFFPKPFLSRNKILAIYSLGWLQLLVGLSIVYVSFEAIMKVSKIADLIKDFTSFLIISNFAKWFCEFSPDSIKIPKDELIVEVPESEMIKIEEGFTKVIYIFYSLYFIMALILDIFFERYIYL